jgi:alpha-glucosidase (family GH31 glycosyl hydrolase)
MDYPECRGRENQGYISGISFGDSIIAYPLTANQSEVKLYLPNGNWYCWFTNKKFEGGKEYILTCDITQIPVFVKEGAILPVLENISAVYEGGTLKIKPAVYGENAEGMLYADDFTTFDFEKGVYAVYRLKVENGKFTVEAENPYNLNNIEFSEAHFIE